MLNVKKTSIYIGGVCGIAVAALAVFFVLRGGSLFNTAGNFTVNRESEPRAGNVDLSQSSFEYKNEAFGFSFRYPEDFQISEFSDEKGNIVVAQDAEGNSFQIFIQPFDEPAFVENSAGEEMALAAERIQQDIPQMVMKNVRLYTLDEVPALVFESEEPSFGPTFEVWFVYPESPQPHGNYLYQITSKAEFGEELTDILNSWKFNNN